MVMLSIPLIFVNKNIGSVQQINIIDHFFFIMKDVLLLHFPTSIRRHGDSEDMSNI